MLASESQNKNLFLIEKQLGYRFAPERIESGNKVLVNLTNIRHFQVDFKTNLYHIEVLFFNND